MVDGPLIGAGWSWLDERDLIQVSLSPLAVISIALLQFLNRHLFLNRRFRRSRKFSHRIRSAQPGRMGVRRIGYRVEDSSMLNAELRVVSGKQAGNVIPLVSGRFLIGREEDCHLRPSNDLVSRHHCVFKADDYTVRIRDLGSTNGTFVNGERLRGEVMLNTGDHVRVGTLEFEVTIKEGAAVAADAEPNVLLDGEPEASQTMIDAGVVGAEDSAADVSLSDTAAFQGDTVYQPPQPQFDPNQHAGMYGQMPMGYQMPYPQQPYMYGQPYGMPMGYPQQPMPYPQMGYPQMPMQPQPTPVPPTVAPAEPEAGAGKKAPPVMLPDPSQTGAKPPEPPPASSGESQAKSKEANVSDKVNDILKQYTQRRPGGTNK